MNRPTRPIEKRCPLCKSAVSSYQETCSACDLSLTGIDTTVTPFFDLDISEGIKVKGPVDCPRSILSLFGAMWNEAIGKGSTPYLEAFRDAFLYHDARALSKRKGNVLADSFLWILTRSHTRLLFQDEFNTWATTVVDYEEKNEPTARFFYGAVTGELREISATHARNWVAARNEHAA